VREYAFELAVCAGLEADRPVARQLGASVARPGGRVMDVVAVEPGPEFDERARVTPDTIPPRVIEADVGVGRAVDWRTAMGGDADWLREAVDEAIAAGFLERERRDGRELIRQTVRYPDDWVGGLVGVENKPDLSNPGDLDWQLRVDVSLALFDRVVVATESYVTGAHLNRIPDPVGVWRVDPATGDREVVREARPLPVDEPAFEPVADRPLRTDVEPVSVADKRRLRRRIAERAYGKGWRPAPESFPPCVHGAATDDGRPYCARFDRPVDPDADCGAGAGCEAFEPADPPAVDVDRCRDERSPWVREPPGARRRQSGLERFL
jgi:hypothetical protein